MEVIQTRNQPAHCKGRGRADSQQHAGTAFAVTLRGIVDALKRFADLQRKRQGMGSRRHALPGALEQFLPEPVFERLDLSTDGAMGDIQFLGRGAVAPGAAGGKKGFQGRQRRNTGHAGLRSSCEQNSQTGEKLAQLEHYSHANVPALPLQ
ncbi:hypothetical protein D3C84_977050 [compost metagenome]